MKLIFILLGLSLFVSQIVGLKSPIQIDQPTLGEDRTWDYQLFVTSWPSTSCESHTPCTIPSYVDYFTIHGLWPNNNDGSYPSYCNDSYPFDFSQIEDLSYDMYHYWPDLYYNETDFWEHEWEKHGTCAMQSTAINNEHDYFKLTLNLYKKFPVDTWLKNAGIVPSSTVTYTTQQISDALQVGLGGNIQAATECSYYNGRQELYEILICVSDPDYEAFQCPTNIYNSFSCPKSGPIYYLPNH